MRLRKVKYAADMIQAHPEIVVLEPLIHKGNWNNAFAKEQPLHLEIGMGKGQFIHTMALQHPDINFLGVEKFDSVLVRALEKNIGQPLPNLRLLLLDAADLPTIFSKGEVERIYLNFSDPWPKYRQKKRRLTHEIFLAKYHSFINKEGTLLFKTDNFGLFMDSMIYFIEYGLTINQISLDLHQEKRIPNVETEFETKFVSMGNLIYYIQATYQEETIHA